MSSTKMNVSLGRWRSWSARSVLALVALVFAVSTMPESARAGEFEYHECIRQLCTSYGMDEGSCVQSCVAELHGPNK
ncbi:MAG: hypothetical protein IPG62_14240 [Sphingomonadales bacterium]|nr:hypothetical protein [Sphingomonadales bacterium]